MEINLDNIPDEYKQELLDLLEKKAQWEKYNSLEKFSPYEFQLQRRLESVVLVVD